MQKLFGVILALALLVAGAIGCATTTENGQVQNTGTATATIQAVSVNYDSDDFYFDWKNGNYKTIALNGNSAAVQGDGLAVQGSVVTISVSGVYAVSGTLTDGSIVIDVNKDADPATVFLVLNGANITSRTSAPIYVKDAKKTVILLENGTANAVAGGSGTIVNEDGEPSAAVFSKADLTISGSGTLTVKADYNDGITSKDDLKITDGTLTVNAQADGIVGRDSLIVKNVNLTVTAGKDGLRSTNETEEGKGNLVLQNGLIAVTAANDGLQAAKILQIEEGNINLNTGGGYPGKSISSGNDFGGPPGQVNAANGSKSAEESTEESKKGLKAGQGILINGGNINDYSYEDAVHSDGEIAFNGGLLTLQSGDDGIRAANNILIENGEITVKNSYESIEGANITVNGGKINTVSSDDGFNINSNAGVLNINGGEITLNANGDGLDSNGSINMTGGTVYVDGPLANNNGALDYNGSFSISGGILVASGSSGMAEAPSNNTQPSILMNYSLVQAAGSTITLKDQAGSTVITFTPSKQYSSVAISSPQLSVGSAYTLYSGDSKIIDFTLADALTYLSESGITTKPQNAGGGGGPNGGRPNSGRGPNGGEMMPRK